MRFDPYDILGVDRRADTAEILSAYRAAAKYTHPDAGGNVDKFKSVKDAYEILIDPQRREVFDKHGTIGEDKPANVMTLIALVFEQALAALLSGPSLDSEFDILNEMRLRLQNSISAENKSARESRGHILLMQNLKRRLQHDDDGENVLAAFLESKIASVETAITSGLECSNIAALALAEIDRYGYIGLVDDHSDEVRADVRQHRVIGQDYDRS